MFVQDGHNHQQEYSYVLPVAQRSGAPLWGDIGGGCGGV